MQSTRPTSPLYLLLFLTCCHFPLFAQEDFRIAKDLAFGDTTQVHQLILWNGDRLVGSALAVSDTTVVFRVGESIDPTQVPLREVRMIGLVRWGDQEVTGTAGTELADLTFLRTAFPSNAKGRFRNILLGYNVAEFNLNRNVQLGVGAILPFGPLFTQRLAFPISDRAYVGASHQSLMPIIVNGDYNLVGEMSVNFTFGNRSRFVNVGFGYLYETGYPMVPRVHLGGGVRIKDRLHLYGELLAANAEFDAVVAPAVSASFARRQSRWRLGLFTVYEPEIVFLPLPFVGFDHRW